MDHMETAYDMVQLFYRKCEATILLIDPSDYCTVRLPFSRFLSFWVIVSSHELHFLLSFLTPATSGGLLIRCTWVPPPPTT